MRIAGVRAFLVTLDWRATFRVSRIRQRCYRAGLHRSTARRINAGLNRQVSYLNRHSLLADLHMGEILDIKRGEAGLFGYGSLLLQGSMEQTLGRPYTRKRYACKLHGWSRRWNALYPNNRYYFSTGGDERLYPASIAYLNICRADVSVNGVLYVITEQELSAFDRREWIYDRVDVTRDLSECQVEGGVVWAYVAKPRLHNELDMACRGGCNPGIIHPHRRGGTG